MTKVPSLTIRFNTPIRHSELPLFRGAVIAALPHDSVLFHNHLGDGLRYSYPLIQYKQLGGKAAIVCIGKGTESVWELFAGNHFDMRLGARNVVATVMSIDDTSTDITIDNNTPHKYRLRRWLPFNQDNYQHYLATESLSARIDQLNHILTGNVLAMLKGIGIILKEQLQVDITSMAESKIIRYKDIKLLSLDATFTTNIVLPEYIGLGKHVSLGYGTVKEPKHENQQ